MSAQMNCYREYAQCTHLVRFPYWLLFNCSQIIFTKVQKKIPVSISATKGSSKEWSITWQSQPRWLTKNVLLSGCETKMPASSWWACGAAIEMHGNNGSFSPGIIELHVCGAAAEPVVPQQKIDKQIKMQICKVSETNLNATKWNCQC